MSPINLQTGKNIVKLHQTQVSKVQHQCLYKVRKNNYRLILFHQIYTFGKEYPLPLNAITKEI